MDRKTDMIPCLSNGLEPFFRTFMENTTDMVFFKNADHVYVAASKAFANIVGKSSPDEIIGRTDLEIFADKELAKRYLDDDLKVIAAGRDLVNYTEPLPGDRYGSTSKHLVKDAEGNLLGIIGMTRDITLDYITLRHYRNELEYLFELPENAYAAVLVDVDAWRVVSQRRRRISDATLQHCHTISQLLTAAMESIVDTDCPAAVFYRDFDADTLRSIYYEKGESYFSFRYQRRLTNGDIHWINNEVRFLVDPESSHLCVMLSAMDIDEKVREEQDVYLSARLDRMTMLLNRDTTISRISSVLAAEPDTKHVLFMLDVDNFKNLNDCMGHQAGDEFLVRLAAGLKGCFRESDIVGRIGGDEFFVLMRSLPNFGVAHTKAGQMLEVFRDICSEYADLQLSCSIGMSAYPVNGATLDTLYSQADEALYRAKRDGKNRCVSAF